MKVLLVGSGGVGEAIATVGKARPWLERLVLGDINLERAHEVQARLQDRTRFPVERIDATDKAGILAAAKKYGVDLILNAVPSEYNNTISDAALQAGCNYLDMAMSDYGADMGRHQFEQAAEWEAKGQLALLGMGVDPGLSDIFARYAEKHLFDEIEEIGVRDGASLDIPGYDFAPAFSIWETLDECLAPPLVWESKTGFRTTELFSEPEVFDFPGGIGPLECVNVLHEEVVLIPRQIRCQRVTFKYGLGERFIRALRLIQQIGLHRTDPIDVAGQSVVPRQVLVALLPDPAHLGDKMTGRTCVGTWVKGTKDGKPRQVYLYQVADNATCMRKYGMQAVAWQTGVNPVIAMELLETGVWKGKGVLGPEAFDPDPYLQLMPKYDFPYGLKEMA